MKLGHFGWLALMLLWSFSFDGHTIAGVLLGIALFVCCMKASVNALKRWAAVIKANPP